MTEQPERPVDHVAGARGDLGAAAEAGEMMADVAVVLLDREGQVLAGEQLSLRDQPVEAFPIVGQEDVPLDADPVEKASAGRIVTPTQLPGQGSPCHRIKGPPEPNFVFLPPTKCHAPLPQCLQPSPLTPPLLVQDHQRGSRPYLSKVKCPLSPPVHRYFAAARQYPQPAPAPGGRDCLGARQPRPPPGTLGGQIDGRGGDRDL